MQSGSGTAFANSELAWEPWRKCSKRIGELSAGWVRLTGEGATTAASAGEMTCEMGGWTQRLVGSSACGLDGSAACCGLDNTDDEPAEPDALRAAIPEPRHTVPVHTLLRTARARGSGTPTVATRTGAGGAVERGTVAGGSCTTEGAANDLHGAGAATAAGGGSRRSHVTAPAATTPSTRTRGRAPMYPVTLETTAASFTAIITPEMTNRTRGVIVTTPMNPISGGGDPGSNDWSRRWISSGMNDRFPRWISS